MRRLTGAEIAKITDILVKRLTLISVRTFTQKRLDIPYDNFVSPLAGLNDGVFQYVDHLNRNWQHYELINAFLAEFPDDPDMLKFAAELGIQTTMVDHQDNLITGLNSLESLVNANPFLDIDILLSKISQVERTVCRIEVLLKNDETHWGTGFLISEDLVMSNYHVFAKLINAPEEVRTVKCLFDYKVTADGNNIHLGNSVKLADNPMLAFSEVDPLDITGAQDLNSDWDPTKLDYAVVRLKKAIGNEAFGPGKAIAAPTSRGWLSFPELKPSIFSGSHAIIIQHPESGPKKIAFGFEQMIGMDDNELRVRYKVNTQKGSSGSPCFNHNFELIALHNVGDPNYNPVYNQGIPIARIKEDLIAKGIELN